MPIDAGDDAVVTGNLGSPAAGLGVITKRVDVGELGFERGLELRGGDLVVALFADVGVGTGVGDEVSGAVAVGDSGLEHLGPEPFDSVGAVPRPVAATKSAWRACTLVMAAS